MKCQRTSHLAKVYTDRVKAHTRALKRGLPNEFHQTRFRKNSTRHTPRHITPRRQARFQNGGGVQVGINAPYSFNRMSGTADKIIEYMTQLNRQRDRTCVCSPLKPTWARQAYTLPITTIRTPVQHVAVELTGRRQRWWRWWWRSRRQWTRRWWQGGARLSLPSRSKPRRSSPTRRLSLSQDKIKDFRKKYEDAGILIQIVKIDNFQFVQRRCSPSYFFTVVSEEPRRARPVPPKEV